MVFETDGKVSFSRVMGAVIIAVVLTVYVRAAWSGEWETIRALSIDLMLLAGALYGLNKWKA